MTSASSIPDGRSGSYRWSATGTGAQAYSSVGRRALMKFPSHGPCTIIAICPEMYAANDEGVINASVEFDE